MITTACSSIGDNDDDIYVLQQYIANTMVIGLQAFFFVSAVKVHFCIHSTHCFWKISLDSVSKMIIYRAISYPSL